MLPKITLTEISASSVVYDHDTGLFPFSPRREVDQNLIKRLKRSIAATGIWQPVVLRQSTMEGIAGNHRFLAYLELGRETGSDEEALKIPAVLVDCDEGFAVNIALIENEVREDLTRWEAIRALLEAFERKPTLVETVFEVDGCTAEQLRFWSEELDYEAEAEARRRAVQGQLTRQWIALINERLGEYPDLRAYFIGQLRNPTWVQARTLEELDQSIMRALINRGIRFEIGMTWNGVPTAKCLGCHTTFADFCKSLRLQGNTMLRSDGTYPHFCPYLRLYPRYTEQFVPDAEGLAVLEVSEGDGIDCYPAEVLIPNGRGVRGRNVQLIDEVEAHCVAPDAHDPEGCFHQQEAEAAQMAVELLTGQGLPAVLPDFGQGREGMGEFVWHCPQRGGSPCTPETCVHAQDDPPGYVIVVQPGDMWKMVCVHAGCGEEAQATLADWESEQRRLERRRQQIALDELRRVSVERTLLASDSRRPNLSVPSFLKTVEPLLVPGWDTPTMFHVVLGWQIAVRIKIAEGMGISDLHDQRVARAFRSQYGELAEKPTYATINQMFSSLREQTAWSEEGLHRWVACLALVRTWRDEVETVDQITQATQRVLAYE
ncbi:MAG: hypothetical protein Kow0063_23470 [Anaerolineae bacterium]